MWISTSRYSTELATETSSHAFMVLGSRVAVMSNDDVELGSELIRYMRHSFRFISSGMFPAHCIEYILAPRSSIQ
ncbi:hypothetical protein TNCV_238001 [Trichonephila clavipes]|nr:hypothetical protein TNCV_238001 [Trichonephila clavipes]